MAIEIESVTEIYLGNIFYYPIDFDKKLYPAWSHQELVAIYELTVIHYRVRIAIFFYCRFVDVKIVLSLF